MPERFVSIRYRGPTPDWSRLAAIELVDTGVGEARLRIEQGVDLAALVAATAHMTDVVSFAYEPPTLSELFRQAVQAVQA